ncbi:MAG TPA: hypothetical protein VNI34_04155 [Candidatus Nitrosotalea sp.]|nr:hypothetical protein [Candidatus Nitrosotalea sp.]
MARKTRRGKARRPARVAAPAPAPAAAQSAPLTEVRSRPVELSLGARSASSRRPGRVVIEGSDPGIPLDRVPYFTSDLARLGITAAAMLALLLVGARIIPLVVR